MTEPRLNRLRAGTGTERRSRYARQRAAHAADGFARIKHGTTHGANMGCKCRPCKDARNEYKQEWKHGTLHLREDDEL